MDIFQGLPGVDREVQFHLRQTFSFVSFLEIHVKFSSHVYFTAFARLKGEEEK